MRQRERRRDEGSCGPAIARALPSFFNCLAQSCFFSIRVLLRSLLLSRFSLFATMSFFVRTVALAASRRSLLSQNNVIPVRASHVSDTSLSLSALKNFVSEATARGSTTTSTDARFYSSIRDVRRLPVFSSSTDRALLNASEFGNNRNSGRRGGEIWSFSVRSQSRSNSVPFSEEIPALSQQVGTRSEHSAALVEEERENEAIMDEFVEVGHKLANAAGTIIMNYFRSRFQIIDKEDSSESACHILAILFPTFAAVFFFRCLSVCLFVCSFSLVLLFIIALRKKILCHSHSLSFLFSSTCNVLSVRMTDLLISSACGLDPLLSWFAGNSSFICDVSLCL